MAVPTRLSTGSTLRRLVLIALIVGAGAAASAYTAGWLSPQRLAPKRLLEALAPPDGAAPGHRRNHAKGICFTGVFEANGAGSALSRALVFTAGHYPVIGRFNFSTVDPKAADATSRVRGLGISISTPDGQVWRSAMIDPPFFPASTPQAFFELLLASKSKAPDAMKTLIGAHPEIAAFFNWAQTAPWTGSYAEDRFNSLNSFVVADASGAEHVVRWSLRPAAEPIPIAPEDLAKRGPDFLEQDIVERVGAGPQRWTMVLTVANPGDPTADPSKAWPDDRQTVEVGTLVVQQIQAERDGPCRDLNFDPTILPSGMQTSDDPFPAARSAVYAKSFDHRTAEAESYPRTTGGQP